MGQIKYSASFHTIEIVNRPRSVPAHKVKSLGAELLEHLNIEPSHITLAFVDDDEMRNLNLQFRQKDNTTDVLSFPIRERRHDKRLYLGDIAISASQAKQQARDFKHSFLTEVLQLFTHGLLHLCGYDHESDFGAMDELELRLRTDIVDQYCR